MRMQALALAAGGSVTVLSHPSLQGIASGSGISGSTAWHGAFRFRQYLTGIKAEGGEQPDSDLRQLEFKKNQYGPIAETIVLRYRDGLFLPVPSTSSLEAAAANQAADELFLKLFARLAAQGRNLSHRTHSSNCAPRIFADEPEAKELPRAKFVLEQAMNRLFRAQKIHVETYGRHGYERLAMGKKP
jgi:RecA-family ATPase